MSSRLENYKTLYQSYIKKVKGEEERNRVTDILKLYKDQKIFSKITVQQILNRYLGQSFKGKAERDLYYFQLMVKYLGVQPLTHKRKEKRVEQQSEIIEKLFKKVERKTMVRYTIKAILYSLTPQASQKKWKNGEDIFYQVTARSFDIKAPKIFPADIYRKHIINVDNDNQWKKILKIMLTNKDFVEKFDRGYIDAIYIIDYDMIPTNTKKYKPLEEELMNQEKISIYHPYITTTVNLPSETLREALENKAHKANECWLNAILDNYSHTLLSQKKNNREKILEIINKTEDNIKSGISVNEMIPFFKYFSIPLRVYDCMGECLTRYDPEKPNHNYKAMYCMVKNDHIYLLNNVQSLKHKQDKPNNDKLKISKNYYTRDKLETRKYRMIDGIKDILDICENEIGIDKLGQTFFDRDVTKIHLILRNDNLLGMVWECMEQGYEPEILDEAGKITRLTIQIVKVAFIVQTQQLRPEVIDGEIVVDNIELYNNMSEAMSRFNFDLFKIGHKSHYSVQDIQYLERYKTIVPSGFLQQCCGECSEIDISKAFTSALANISQIPIFNEFDIWKPYNKHNIMELSLYKVMSNKITLFFNKRYCLVFGRYLKHFIHDVKILEYKEPSFIKDVNYSEIIETLFNSHFTEDEELDKQIKKTISNVNCGMLEKMKNKRRKSKIFESAGEALYYQDNYGGTISVLKRKEAIEQLMENPLDAGLGPISTITEQDDDKKYYILTKTEETQLDNGFIFIKELLLQSHNFKMYEAYKKLNEANVNIFSVKTDAFIIEPEHIDIAKGILTFSDKLGDWRVSKELFKPLQQQDYTIVENELLSFEETKTTVVRVELKDEWDVDELAEHILKYKRTMIRAKFPGSGKSYICEHLAKLGYNVLFVCPTNRLAQKYKTRGVTLNKFFGVGFKKEEEDDNSMVKNMVSKAFDHAEYNIIVFDEIYFSSVRMLAKIRKFCLDNPDKITVATGDTSQLPPVAPYTNTREYATYADECINIIFPYEIYLKENKRLKTKEDRDRLEQIYNDIFNPNISLRKTINKYFKMTDKHTTSNKAIAYRNDTCYNVSKHIRKQLGKQKEFEAGETLICREYFRINIQDAMYVNYEYDIIDISDKTLTLQDIANDKRYEVKLADVRKKFIFSYCSTCHSAQGQTIDEGITIYDWKFHFISPSWLWTAVTRATSLDNVYFYDYVENDFNKDLITSHFKRKVESYKEQDIIRINNKLPKDILKKYVTAEWLMSCVNKFCISCGNEFFINFRCGNTFTNITADRIDNSLYHTIDNIQPLCKNCNCSWSNKQKLI